MKYLITRNVFFNDPYFKVLGFLEKESERQDGVFVEDELDRESIIDYKNAKFTLEQLNLLFNDLYATLYKTDYHEQKLQYCQILKIADNLFDHCLKNAVVAEGVSPAVADIIISKSYESGHSGGYSDVVCHIWDNIEFVKQILAVK